MRVPFVLGFLESIGCLLSAISEAKGSVRCLCSASECPQEGTLREGTTGSCEADTFCYVQMVVPGTSSSRSIDGRGQVVRGCIDARNPLLCENKRPDWYSGPWPVLYCCAGDWCNAVVVPTLPPWAKNVRGGEEDGLADSDIRSSSTEDSLDYYDGHEAVAAPNDPGGGGGGGRWRPPGVDADFAAPGPAADPGRRNAAAAAPAPRTLNPVVHVVLPVVGACAVAALGLVSVLMLRRRRRRRRYEGGGGGGGPPIGPFAWTPSRPPPTICDHAYCRGDAAAAACRTVLVNAADEERRATWRMKMHLDCGRTTTTSEGNESKLFITSP